MSNLLVDLSPPPGPAADLSHALWACVQKSVLLGDLYLPSDAGAHDLLLQSGCDAAEWAEELERLPREGSVLTSAREALGRAQSLQGRFAPLG